jgi:hypothetical protein
MEQTIPAAVMLDKQRRFWIDRLLPSLLPLTTAQLRARRTCQSRALD